MIWTFSYAVHVIHMPTDMDHGYSNSSTDLDQPIETYRSILCHRLFESIGANCVFECIIYYLLESAPFNGSIKKLPYKNMSLLVKNVYKVPNFAPKEKYWHEVKKKTSKN